MENGPKHIILPDEKGNYWVIKVPYKCNLPTKPFTVAVVGNATSLFEKRYGQDIDSHDVVIRINRAAQFINISKEYNKSHGIKTDIWCMWCHKEYEGESVRTHRNMCQMVWWDYTPELGVEQIYTGWFFDHILPWTPSTGLMILAWLSTLPCTVDVYGFDWKATPTYTDPNREFDQSTIHNFELEKQLCEEYFQASGNFKFHS